jgi:hypothetical protein
MMFTRIAIVATCLLASVAESQDVRQMPTSADRETTWSAYLAGEVNGEAEHRLPDGSRIDILTDQTAWEVEWCEKWEESIGQALFYGIATNKTAGVWLLKKHGDDEDYLRCLLVVESLGKQGVKIELRVTEVKP